MNVFYQELLSRAGKQLACYYINFFCYHSSFNSIISVFKISLFVDIYKNYNYCSFYKYL